MSATYTARHPLKTRKSKTLLSLSSPESRLSSRLDHWILNVIIPYFENLHGPQRYRWFYEDWSGPSASWWCHADWFHLRYPSSVKMWNIWDRIKKTFAIELRELREEDSECDFGNRYTHILADDIWNIQSKTFKTKNAALISCEMTRKTQKQLLKSHNP